MTLTDLRKVTPYTITQRTDDVPLTLEVDTGSAATVVGKRTPGDTSRLQPSNYIFWTFTVQLISVSGKPQVEVKYEGQIYTSTIHVAERSPTSMLGRDWIKRLPGFHHTKFEHLHTLSLVLQSSAENSLCIKRSKCQVMVKSVDYLSCRLYDFGLYSQPNKFEPILNTLCRRTTAIIYRHASTSPSFLTKFIHRDWTIIKPSN